MLSFSIAIVSPKSNGVSFVSLQFVSAPNATESVFVFT